MIVIGSPHDLLRRRRVPAARVAGQLRDRSGCATLESTHERRHSPDVEREPARAEPARAESTPARAVLRLQRSAGNAAVAGLVQRTPRRHTAPSGGAMTIEQLRAAGRRFG